MTRFFGGGGKRSELLLPAPLQGDDKYLDEMHALLLRGHALHEPLCTCPPCLSAERCAELGIRHARDQRHACPLPRRVVSVPLRQALEALALTPCSEAALLSLVRSDERFETSPTGSVRLACFCEDDIRTGEELLCGLRLRGLLLVPSRPLPCERELQRLLEEGAVRCLPRPEGRLLCKEVCPQRRVDADFLALWHSSTA